MRFYEAYLCVYSFAMLSCFALLFLYRLAIPGISGSSGLASHSNELSAIRTEETVRLGDHWSLSMSRQTVPLELMLQWYILVTNEHFGGDRG